MSNLIRRNPVLPPPKVMPGGTQRVFTGGGPKRAPGVKPYTAEPEPPQYINEVWPDGGISGPDAIALVYGERILQGRVIAEFPAGDVKIGIIGLCAGPIDSIVGVWFDDWMDYDEVLIPYDPAYYYPTGKDGWTFQLGTLSQAAIGTTLATYYGANQSFPSLAYLVAYVPQFVVNGSFIIPTDRPWPGGFRARVKGCKVLDTRTSTTAWSDNPAMCLRHFLLSENYGGNLVSGDLDATSFEDAADYCDASGLTLNIVIDGSSNAKQWADTIAACFGARLYLKDGKYALWIEGVVADSGILFDTTNSRDWSLFETATTDRPTRVVVEYSRASNNWAPDQAISEVSGSVAVRETSYKLDGVTDEAQAKWLADLYLRTQQTAKWRVEFIASTLAARLALGTRFKLTFPNGCTAQDFLATEISPEEGGEYKITARQYDPNSYTPGSVPTPPPAPAPGTLPSDTPPDITIDSVEYYEPPESATATQVVYRRYRKINFTLPSGYLFGASLVVAGHVETVASSIPSDLAWSALGDTIEIPLTGNFAGEVYSLYWPVSTGSITSIFHPNGTPAGSTDNAYAHQVTVRLRNIIGLLSPGVVHRTPNTALSSGTSVDGGQGTFTGRSVKLLEETANGLSGWTLTTPAALSANRTLTLPDAAPEAGVLAVDASGNISFRKDFSFRADKDGTNQTGITTATHTKVTFGTERFDVGSGYDAANSKFLPGVAGKYLISAALAMTLDATATQLWILLYLSGTAVVSNVLRSSDGSGGSSISVASVLSLSASDYVEVYVYHTKSGDGAVIGTSSLTYFSGVRVG